MSIISSITMLSMCGISFFLSSYESSACWLLTNKLPSGFSLGSTMLQSKLTRSLEANSLNSNAIYFWIDLKAFNVYRSFVFYSRAFRHTIRYSAKSKCYGVSYSEFFGSSASSCKFRALYPKSCFTLIIFMYYIMNVFCPSVKILSVSLWSRVVNS